MGPELLYSMLVVLLASMVVLLVSFAGIGTLLAVKKMPWEN